MAVSYVGVSNAIATGTTSATAGLPTGAANKDRIYLCVVSAPNGTATNTPTSWTKIVNSALGAGTYGSGTGPRQVTVMYRDYDGLWTMPAVTTSGTGAAVIASAVAFRPGAGEAFVTETTTTGSTTSTTSQTFSVTGAANITLTANDMVLAVAETPANATATNPTLTAAGSTIGSLTERVDGGTGANGNLGSIKVHTAAVTAGASTAAPVHGMTLTSSTTGGAAFIRVRTITTAPSGADAGGATANINVWEVFTRTGTTNAGSPPTSYAWTLLSVPATAPELVGATISTTAAISWRPTTSGTYGIRFTATNSAGSASADVTMTVAASAVGATGTRVVMVVGDRTAPNTGDPALQTHWLNTAPFQLVAVRDDNDAAYSGGYDVVFISDSANTGTLGGKYSGDPLLWGNGGGSGDANYLMASNINGNSLASGTSIVLTGAAPNAGLSGTQTILSSAQPVMKIPQVDLGSSWGILLAVDATEPDLMAVFRYDQTALLGNGTTSSPSRRIWFISVPSAMAALNATGFSLLDSWVSWLAAPPTPAVFAGRDNALAVGSTFTTTGGVSSASAVTSTSWTIVSGPAGVTAGTTLSTTANLSWAPTITGNYVLRLSATNANGTSTHDVSIAAFAASPIATYRYYRFQPTALRNATTANSMQVAEVEFRFLGARVSTSGATATSGGGSNDSSPNEVPAKAIDNDPNSKWLNFNKTTGYLLVDFATATSVDSMRIITANDAPERDPTQWTLEGSADTVSWDLLTTAAPTVPATRYSYSSIVQVQGYAQLGSLTSRASATMSMDPSLLTITSTVSATASSSMSISPVLPRSYAESATATTSTTISPVVTPSMTGTASASMIETPLPVSRIYTETATAVGSPTVAPIPTALATVTATGSFTFATSATVLAHTAGLSPIASATTTTFLFGSGGASATAVATSVLNAGIVRSSSLSSTALAVPVVSGRFTLLNQLQINAATSTSIAGLVTPVVIATAITASSITGLRTQPSNDISTGSATVTISGFESRNVGLTGSSTARLVINPLLIHSWALTATVVTTATDGGYYIISFRQTFPVDISLTGIISPLPRRRSTVLIEADGSGNPYSITGMQAVASTELFADSSVLTKGPPARFDVTVDATAKFSVISQLVETITTDITGEANLHVVQSLTTIFEDDLPALLTAPVPVPEPAPEPEPERIPVFRRTFLGLRP